MAAQPMTLTEAKTICREATQAARFMLELSGFAHLKVMHCVRGREATGYLFELAVAGYAGGEKISLQSKEGKAVTAAILAAKAEIEDDMPIRFELFRSMPGRRWPS